jgi:hypothetical protein
MDRTVPFLQEISGHEEHRLGSAHFTVGGFHNIIISGHTYAKTYGENICIQEKKFNSNPYISTYKIRISLIIQLLFTNKIFF